MVTVHCEGYDIKVFSSMYMDYGLEITRAGETLYYNPHCLSCESYGCDYGDDGDDEPIPWTKKEWEERLEWEAGELIDCFVPMFEQEG